MKQMGTSKIMAAAALAASVFMSSAAGAAPAAATQGLAKQADSGVQVVRDGRHGGWRGHHHRGHWGGGGWGWGAAALGAGLLLSAPYAYGYDDGGYYDDDDNVASYSYRGRYAGAGGEARCEATFRSYDPASGTYMGYDGVRRTCPYL